MGTWGWVRYAAGSGVAIARNFFIFVHSTVLLTKKIARCIGEKSCQQASSWMCLEALLLRNWLNEVSYTPFQIKGATDFFRFNFYKYRSIFIIFVHNFASESQSTRRKNSLPHVCFVATIPYKTLRHKSNTFYAILALCTCRYRSNLWKPESIKRTKHTRKS